MKTAFATTSNSIAFDEAVRALARRGAREASWLLLCGPAGHGKSALARHYAAEEGGVYLRAKAHWTPASLLAELVQGLGQVPERGNAGNFALAARVLCSQPRPLVVDEIDHVLGRREALESLRDLSDVTGAGIVVVGMEEAERRLKRFPQVYSRISQVVRTRAQDRGFVAAILADLCEVAVEEGVADIVLSQTGGHLREILDAIAMIEAIGRRQGAGACVTAAMAKAAPLTGGRAARPGR
jgi:hypothetical protein